MAFDINVFYNVLKSIYDDYSAKEQAVKFDVDLSDSGRQKKLDKINSDRIKATAQLQETFTKEYDKSMAVIDTKLNGKKESAKDKAKAYMDTQLVKDFNLSTYHDGSPILDDNSRTSLILSAIADTHKERMDFARQQSLSQGNESWYRQQLQKGMTDKNIDRLELLSKSLDLKPDDIADKLKGEYESVIQQLRIDALSPEQRQAMSERATLQRDKELLDYSFANVSQRNEYVDARTKETPVNTLTYQGGSDRVLGKSPIQRQFSQYKTNK